MAKSSSKMASHSIHFISNPGKELKKPACLFLIMGDTAIEYLYHIYKISEQESENVEYVAEGPGTRSPSYDPVEPLIADLDHLPKAILREHLYYLQNQDFSIVSKDEDMYMAFSFNPTCQKILREGNIYSTHSLNGIEQEKFCKNIKGVYNSLDDVIDLKQEGNPLGQ